MHNMPSPEAELLTIGHPAVDPTDDLTNCQTALRTSGWWDHAKMQERWPLSTSDAARLLRLGGEYDVLVAGLLALVERRLFPKPGIAENGELEWNAVDVVLVSGVLETRRQWRRTPSGHDAKKHPCQLILEAARSAGHTLAIVDGHNNPRYDVKHLLGLLVVCDSHEGREKITVLLKAVLEVDHEVVV